MSEVQPAVTNGVAGGTSTPPVGLPDLNARRAEIRSRLASAPAAPAATPSEDKTAPAAGGDGAPTDAPKSAAGSPAEAPAVETKPAESPDVAQLIRAQRKLSEEKKATEARHAEIEARAKAIEEKAAGFKHYEESVTRLSKAQALLDKGSRVAALQALFPAAEIEDFYWDIIKAHGSEDRPAATQDVSQLVNEAVNAALKAERDKVENEHKAKQQTEAQQFEGLRSRYWDQAGQVFKANIKEFPAIAALKLKAEDLFDHVETYHKRTGNSLTPLEALRAIEKEKLAEARAAAGVQDAPARAPTTLTPDSLSDPGKPPTEGGKTLWARREAMKRKLIGKG